MDFINSDTLEVDPKFVRCAANLMEAMSVIRYEKEARRVDQIKECLKPIGRFQEHNVQRVSSNLTLLVSTAQGIPRSVINIEVKKDLSSGGNSPVDQNILYYVHFTKSNWHACLSPMLLISISGCHYFQVFGAVYFKKEVWEDPLCGPLSLLLVLDDPTDALAKLARVLQAISKIIPCLDFYYNNHANPTDDFPYYKASPSGTLCYKKAIALNGNTLEAELRINGSEDSRNVVVKFTRQYGDVVHHFLHRHGMAPELICFDVLPGGWKVIVMENVKGKNLEEICRAKGGAWQGRKAVETALCEAVALMREKNFVHGDLRRPNIMIKHDEINVDSPTPIIVDFDWAGIERQVKYPAFLSKSECWAHGVFEAGPILCDHDHFMAKNIFLDVPLL